MANSYYTTFQTARWGPYDTLSANLKALLLDATYVYSGSHEFLDDIDAGARLSTSDALTGVTGATGYLNTSDPVFEAVPGGDTATQVVLFDDTGVEATSRLIARYHQNASNVEISIATDGSDITVVLDADGWGA